MKENKVNLLATTRPIKINHFRDNLWCYTRMNAAGIEDNNMD